MGSVLESIPYSTQWIDERDIEAVVDVLRGGWITQGPVVKRFETEFAAYCGAKYAVAVSSGTAALHLACLAAGIAVGDKVATTPITFVASANCALYVGGEPRFVDIEPATRNLSPQGLAKLFSQEKIKAVIPVHFSGLPCEMELIRETAERHGSIVIEDACHALGARYRTADDRWVNVGACENSDMTVFSFHPVKQITTGEGGAVTTNSRELYEKLTMLRTHGITKAPDKMEKNHGPWYYEMQMLGFNYRLTDFQCALGSSQLAKNDAWVARREQIAARYDEAFAPIKTMTRPARLPGYKSAHHLYVIEVDDRDKVFDDLLQRGLGVQVHYIPVHLQPYYGRRLGYKEGDFPQSEAYYRRCVSIPLYPKMTDDQVEIVINTVADVVGVD